MKQKSGVRASSAFILHQGKTRKSIQIVPTLSSFGLVTKQPRVNGSFELQLFYPFLLRFDPNWVKEENQRD